LQNLDHDSQQHEQYEHGNGSHLLVHPWDKYNQSNCQDQIQEACHDYSCPHYPLHVECLNCCISPYQVMHDYHQSYQQQCWVHQGEQSQDQ
jgi:hypothetical protein